MPRLTKEQKLEQARKVAAQARANLRSAAAAMAAETRKDNRKRDTRRKILLGAWVISSAETNLSVSKSIERFIAGIEEERDKEAFADWPVPAPTTKAPAPQAPASIAKPAASDQGVVSPPSQPAPAPAQGAFGGTTMPPQPNTAPAPTGAPSAQPIKATTT